MAPCETKLPSGHHSRRIINPNCYQNRELRIIPFCVMKHDKNQAPVLRGWTLSKMKIPFIRRLNTFCQMSHSSRTTTRYLFNSKISVGVPKIHICEGGSEWPQGRFKMKRRRRVPRTITSDAIYFYTLTAFWWRRSIWCIYFKHYSLQSVFFHQKSLHPLPVLHYCCSTTLFQEKLSTLGIIFLTSCIVFRVTFLYYNCIS